MKTIRNITLAALTVLSLAPSVASAAAALNRVPGGPSNTPTSSQETPCEYGMGHLRRVSVQQINGIDEDWRVWVRPVCQDSPHAPVRSMGNATQLIGAIGRNDTLELALEDARFLADDVVGVQLTKGQRVTLWVHPSLYR